MKKHAVHVVCFVNDDDSVQVQCFTSWSEADRAMRGRPHVNKKFYSREEAEAWLHNLTWRDYARARLYPPAKTEDTIC